MFQRKEVWAVGICALVLALGLRMAGSVGVLPLQNSDMLSFLVYLQTGRVVRYPATPNASAPQETSPAPTQPMPQRPAGLILTTEDAASVQLNDLVDYEPSERS